jgi:hypothetical protein
MFGSGKKGNAAKKAYEIAYALFRISAKIAESSVKEKIESQAIDLLISANAEEYGGAAKTVAAIDALVKFAVDLNMVSISNGDVLLREIGAMNEAIIECLDKSDDVDVSKFFPKTKETVMHDVTPTPAHIAAVPAKVGPQERNSSFVIPANRISSRAPTQDSGENGLDTGLRQHDNSFLQRDDSVVSTQSGNPAIAIKPGNRQIAILDKIRQSGNCKLKEIQDILPDCSERTIRYDLEELIERNLVERIGAGGPAVSYRIRQIA